MLFFTSSMIPEMLCNVNFEAVKLVRACHLVVLLRSVLLPNYSGSAHARKDVISSVSHGFGSRGLDRRLIAEH